MDLLETILPHLIPFFTISRGYADRRTKLNKRNEHPRIIVFGKMRDINTGKIVLCKGSRKFVLLEKILRDIANEHFPDFNYTNFQINHNVECLPHFDSKNAGESITFTLGDFEGGELMVGDEPINTYKTPYKFNGSKISHSTAPFTGDRFCVIFYSSREQQLQLENKKI